MPSTRPATKSRIDRATVARSFLLIVPALLLAACGADDRAPGGVSEEEARGLNEAAAALDIGDADANDSAGR